MSAILVIAVAGTGASTGHLSEREDSQRRGERVALGANPSLGSRSEKCHARKGLRFYRDRYVDWRELKGGVTSRPSLGRRPRNCADARYLAKVWKRKAHAARRQYERWVAYNYHWWKWMPAKWQRIGACETGYGQKPGRWDWNSGTYQGAFGFYHGTWDQYKPAGAPSEAYLATPREQYQAALNVYAAHGYGAWGCGGA